MKKNILIILGTALLSMAACNPQDGMEVKAGFTTDKDEYQIGDEIVITNTSTAKNTQIAVYKWEILGEVIYEETPKPFVIDEGGEYPIKLTVTSEPGSLKSEFVKTVSVVDDGKRPTADFTWKPEKIVAGENVTFTDKSVASSPEYKIVKWEWLFGAVAAQEQNPEITFASHGEITVSLTVTDDNKRTATKTATLTVEKSPNSLGVLWAQTYDESGYVYGTSPATSADGEYVYVTSSNYNLVCFDKSGTRLWKYDMGANGEPNRGSDYQNPTPAVDADGTVFVPVGDNTSAANANASASLYALKGGKDGGSRKWYVSIGAKSSMRPIGAPVITDKYVMLFTNSAPADGKHFRIYDKESSAFSGGFKCSGGTYGGAVALKNGFIYANAGKGSSASYGTHFLILDQVLGNSSTKVTDLCKKDRLNGSQPAVSPDGKVLILCLNAAHDEAAYGKAIVYCYDSKVMGGKDKADANNEPIWFVGLKGENILNNEYGVAVNNGVAYVSTDKYITAISLEDGSTLWESELASGTIYGVPAIDNEGYIYCNDTDNGSLVKISPSDGTVMASVKVASELRSSPAIAADGIIYVNGIQDGKPILFAIEGTATGYAADAWSQMGGNPSRTGYMY